jgi:hypothetical protein
MFQNEPIDDRDIMYILEHPWEKSKGEWLLANESERRETLLYIKGLLEKTKLDGLSKLWKTEENEPIAILGAFKTDKREYQTFFICSSHMPEHSIGLSFEMRNILRDLATRHKGYTCVQYATPHNTDQKSWFRFLGFKHKPEGDTGGKLYYEFASPVR